MSEKLQNFDDSPHADDPLINPQAEADDEANLRKHWFNTGGQTDPSIKKSKTKNTKHRPKGSIHG